MTSLGQSLEMYLAEPPMAIRARRELRDFQMQMGGLFYNYEVNQEYWQYD